MPFICEVVIRSRKLRSLRAGQGGGTCRGLQFSIRLSLHKACWFTDFGGKHACDISAEPYLEGEYIKYNSDRPYCWWCVIRRLSDFLSPSTPSVFLLRKERLIYKCKTLQLYEATHRSRDTRHSTSFYDRLKGGGGVRMVR